MRPGLEGTQRAGSTRQFVSFLTIAFRGTMAAFLHAQLDFVYFCYGLAFLLLGTVSLAVARLRQSGSWLILGLFGFTHGAFEWLHLVAYATTDWPPFAVFRTALMAFSYFLLLEFARQEAIDLGVRPPERGLYIPLGAAVLVAGLAVDLNTAQAAARYLVGFPGALAAGLVFACHARDAAVGRWPFLLAATAFALYAVATGLIVPSASFWPASLLNEDWFAAATGIPIELVRGTIAFLIVVSFLAIRGQALVQDEPSGEYAGYFPRHLAGTLVAITIVLASGWALTDHLGAMYERKAEAEASGELDLVAGRLDGETASIKGMVQVIAGAPAIRRLMAGGGGHDVEHILNLAVAATGAELGYIADTSGTILIASGDLQAAPSSAVSFAASQFFKRAKSGEAAHGFVFDAATGETDFYASYPIRGASGTTVSLAVLKKSLAAFKNDLLRYDRSFFLVDSEGVVFLTNRPEMLFRTMWPSARFVSLPGYAVFDREIAHSGWRFIDSARGYVERRYLNGTQWSLVIVKPAQEIIAGRVLGIAVTLAITLTTLMYVSAKWRSVHDRIQMMKRLELQELATELKLRATTDPLTGLKNRRRFDEVMAREMSRAQRYGTPLSLVLYDVDHFKRVNDVHGHLVGDKVLTQLSELISSRIRSTDELSRWGGEEFAILLPGADAKQAFAIADDLRDLISDIPFDEVGTVTCSFGVAQYNGQETANEFVARADAAVYRAKMNGRNRIELDPARPLVHRLERNTAA
jgi:diguanylate cyclase (GGDEF)-like protein